MQQGTNWENHETLFSSIELQYLLKVNPFSNSSKSPVGAYSCAGSSYPQVLILMNIVVQHIPSCLFYQSLIVLIKVLWDETALHGKFPQILHYGGDIL